MHLAMKRSGVVDSCGFTLVELLAVVAVVAILSALLLPVLAGAKDKGHAISCLNNQRQLSVACLLYAEDANERFPYNLGTSEIRKRSERNEYINWTTPVMSWELDTDNTNTALLTQGGIGPYLGRTGTAYSCPKDRVVSDIQAAAGWTRRVRSISMNAMVGNAGEFSAEGANVNNPYYRQFFKASDVPKPSEIFVFIEEHPHSINDGYFLNRLNRAFWMDLPASFHNGGANLTYVDGHAEAHKWRSSSTRVPARPDAVRLPFRIPSGERWDFYWLTARMTIYDYDSDHEREAIPHDPQGRVVEELSSRKRGPSAPRPVEP